MMRRAVVSAGVAALVGVAAPVTSASAAANRPAATPRTVQVWLAGRQLAAQRFVNAVSAPGSPAYRRFLSPVAFTQRFGPSATQVRAVQSFLAGEGFTAVRASANDDYVSATMPAIQSDVRDLAFPASLRQDVLTVTGVDAARPRIGATLSTGRRATAACSKYWGQKTHSTTPAFHGVTNAAVPVCGYSAHQLRDAYGLSSADTGKGTTIALIQVGGPDKMFQALTDYARRNGLPGPRAGQYREQMVGQGDRNPRCDNQPLAQEAPMDSEAAYAVAPGADQLMVDGDDCLKDVAQALFDAELAPLTGSGSQASAAIESISYELPDRLATPANRKAAHAVALRAAAEGVSVLYGSGDEPGVASPSSDPDVTAVGGTTLGIGAHGQRLFETGWSTDLGERVGVSGPWHDTGIEGASGGGVSGVWARPGYQKGVVRVALSRSRHGHLGRTTPDLAANADLASGGLYGAIVPHRGSTLPYTPFVGSGTSEATPLVAGIVADAEQGGRTSLGFLNPRLYSLAGGRAFHDIQPLGRSTPQTDRAFYTSGPVEVDHRFAIGFRLGLDDAQGRGTDQVTARGYDTTTGLGSPDGPAFIKGLRAGEGHR
jgi:subtilase family serine protease